MMWDVWNAAIISARLSAPAPTGLAAEFEKLAEKATRQNLEALNYISPEMAALAYWTFAHRTEISRALTSGLPLPA